MRWITFSFLSLIATCSMPINAPDFAKPVMPAQGNRNRMVRVVTISQSKLERGSSDLLEKTMARLDQAASF